MVSSKEKEKCLKKLIRMSFQSGREKEVREQLYDLLLRDTDGGKLYRFRPFDKDGYSLKNFEEGTVYCSRPSAFNDPFEAKPGMSLVNMNEEVYGKKIKQLWSFGEILCQVVNNEMRLESFNQDEQRIIKRLLANERLIKFIKREKEETKEVQEELDAKAFLQEFLGTIIRDKMFEGVIRDSADEILRVFENISSEELMQMPEEESSFQWFARVNGVSAENDELTCLISLTEKLILRG